ncbi:DUF2141 domain-containing protein [Rhodohalobacter sp.]|nr:DUF2141 domain-containing protein [Rhodohalobacter sp.]MDZ7756077.1 DUF2141 domain-containing protein [Rhodohalobacter sp.]
MLSAIYHDKNTNGELDTNLSGIPEEAYGFSNNARGNALGRPRAKMLSFQ